MLRILLTIDLLRAAAHRDDAAEQRVREVYDAIDEATARPSWRAELRRICQRESWCNLFGVVGHHAVDARASLGRARWDGAVAAGILRPEVCPEHALGPDPSRWSTWGVFGQTATAVGHLEVCLGPEAMSDPAIAARAAALTFDRLCSEQRLCSCEDRVAWWTGIGRWPRLSPLTRLHKRARVCGGGGALELASAGVAMLPWATTRLAARIGGWLS